MKELISFIGVFICLNVSVDARSEFVEIPAYAGRVVGHSVELNPNSSKTLYLIQDAHVNTEAQRNIAAILGYLAEEHHTDLVLLEGGFGESSLRALKKRGSKTIRTQVAEQYLESGMISGAEYFDLLAPYDISLWGIENKDLYDRNYLAYEEAKRLRSDVANDVDSVNLMAEKLQNTFYSEGLKTHRDLEAEFRKAKISSVDFLDSLEAIVPNMLEESLFPSLWAIKKSEVLGQLLNMQRVAEEQQILLGTHLKPHLKENDLSVLRQVSQKVREGSLAKKHFYDELSRLSEQVSFVWPDEWHLTKYYEILQLNQRVDVESAVKEINAYSELVKENLIKDPIQRMVSDLSEAVEKINRLFELAWNSGDYKYYLEHEDYFETARWISVVDTLEEVSGEVFSVKWNFSALDEGIRSAVEFYHTAMERDAEMLKNAVNKMQIDNASAASLIIGGFHTANLTQLFNEIGYNVVVITPNLKEEENGRLRYEQVLNEKYQRANKSNDGTGIETKGLYAWSVKRDRRL